MHDIRHLIKHRIFGLIYLINIILLTSMTQAAENNSESDPCPVCLNQILLPVTTDCGHTFDYFCLKKWLKNKDDCPGCRKRLKPGKNTEIFPKPFDLDPLLTELNCSTLSWGKTSFKSLATAILFHENLVMLKVSAHCFKENDGKFLAGLLQSKTPIQHLDLSDLSLSPDNIQDLADSLSINTGLKGLSLHGNHISNHDLVFLAKGLTENQSLEALDLSRTRLQPSGISSFISIITKRNQPVEIDLRWNDLEEDDQDDLNQIVKGNPHIKLRFGISVPPKEQLCHLLGNSEKILNGTLKRGEYDLLRFTLRFHQSVQKCQKIFKKNDPDLIKSVQNLNLLLKKIDDHKIRDHT